ncbi:MAG: helix-turn-helix domain-containing protein [Solobacterium sp.]|nr:helix-turn-helix domain-containing protein [Solobacterium sp.]
MAAQNSYKHLSLEERKNLEELLHNPEITLKQIGVQMERDPKCIREEIKRHRIRRVRKNQHNKCGKQNDCIQTRLCTHCLTGQCRFCTHDNCNEICTNFFPDPVCKRTTRFPYVCNGCPDNENCKLPRMYYIAT